jgi:hypothetical protein
METRSSEIIEYPLYDLALKGSDSIIGSVRCRSGVYHDPRQTPSEDMIISELQLYQYIFKASGVSSESSVRPYGMLELCTSPVHNTISLFASTMTRAEAGYIVS